MNSQQPVLSSPERGVNRQVKACVAIAGLAGCILVLAVGVSVWLLVSMAYPPPASQLSGLPTLRPQPTVGPSPTPGPEVNVALNKPIRVSSSWEVDPPERAVNGNPDDRWGAGGPPPQWIEVDLQGLYSVSRIKLVNAGSGTHRVLGRGLGNDYHVLHNFAAGNNEYRMLDFAPETAWKDISTIRIEITGSGSGWVGLGEIQIFSRYAPEPLPALSESPSPLFLAKIHPAALEPISTDNAVRVRQLAIIGRGTINQLAWSPDGRTLAAAGTVGLWLYDPADLELPPRLLEGHTRDVLGAAFTRDGTTLFSSSQDGTVKQWETATGDLKQTIPLWNDFSFEVGTQKRDPEVWSIAFDLDRMMLASGGFDGALRLWNLKTSSQAGSLNGHSKQILSLAFSPDGKLLASSGLDGKLILWDVAARKQLASLSGHEGLVQTLAFSPDGKILATGGSDTTIRLWDTKTGKEISTLNGHTNNVVELDFNPDGRTLVSGSWDGTLHFWDVEIGKMLPMQGELFGVTGMAFRPDGASLATSTGFGLLQLWDPATGSPGAGLLAHTSPVVSIAISPDNRLLASGGEDTLVRVWEIGRNELVGFLVGHTSKVTSVAFSPDGKLLASGDCDGFVRIWETVYGKEVATLESENNCVLGVAFSPDGKILATGGTDKLIRLWDTDTWEERAALTGHTAEVESIAFSPDGRWLASGSADKTLKIWHVISGTESGVLRGHTSFVRSTAFGPDGRTLVSGAGDHWLRVWDLEWPSGKVTGTIRFTPIGHGGWVLSAAFSPDGAIIAAANVSTTSYWVAPGEIHLYAADSGFPYNLLRGHTKRINSIVFSPDGRLIASGSADGTVRFWGVP